MIFTAENGLPPASAGTGAATGATGLEELLAPDQKAPPPASAGAGAATQNTSQKPATAIKINKDPVVPQVRHNNSSPVLVI